MHYARLIEEYQRDNAKSKVIDIKYIPSTAFAMAQ